MVGVAQTVGELGQGGRSQPLSERAAVVLLALGLDLMFGEPSNRLHPVAWLGSLVNRVLRKAPRTGWLSQLVFGTALTLGIVGGAAGCAVLAMRLAGRSRLTRLLVGAALVKCSLSVRMLHYEAGAVERALRSGDLDGARWTLRSLVSRDTSDLPSDLLAAAAIESVAENACDSFVAPVLYHLLLGPPGAFAYRAANTLDAMIGYRGEYEWLGKSAARLDDMVNLLPSRLTTLLIVATAAPLGLDAVGAWRTAIQHHRRTASPNAGWPMAAMAGALKRQLEKSGHYVLGDGPTPDSSDVARARRLLVGLVAVAVLGIIAFERATTGTARASFPPGSLGT